MVGVPIQGLFCPTVMLTEMFVCFPIIIATGMPLFCSVWATDVCRGSHTFLLRDVFAVIAIFCTTTRSLLLAERYVTYRVR